MRPGLPFSTVDDTPAEHAADIPGRLAELELRMTALERGASGIDRRMGPLAARLDALSERLDRLVAEHFWVSVLPPSTTLVSVIMPTRDRAGLLAEAIDSVRAQVHEAWELIVVDDGSSDGTRDVLDAIGDPRVRVLHLPESIGAPAARNRALDLARGALIAYLDDDNLMGPLWLRAVVAAFERHPEAQLAYGALVGDHAGADPTVLFQPFDRRILLQRNYIDRNVIAHRAGPRETEGILYASDWDLVRRLTCGAAPLAIPVMAAAYRTGAATAPPPGREAARLSAGPTARSESLATQQRLLRDGPLRVLLFDGPGIPVAEDRARAVADGLEARVTVTASDGHLEAAVRRDAPQVALATGPDAVNAEQETLVRLELPFALLERGDGSPEHEIVARYSLFGGDWPDPGDEQGLERLLRGLDVVRARLSGTPVPEAWFGQPAGADRS